MARIALAMPHPNLDALMARVADLPQPLKAKRDLFAALALDGHVLDINPIMDGVDEWLKGAEESVWEHRQNTWEIESWLELLPFTNRPEQVVDGMTKIREFYAAGHHHEFVGVMQAIASLPERMVMRSLLKWRAIMRTLRANTTG